MSLLASAERVATGRISSVRERHAAHSIGASDEARIDTESSVDGPRAMYYGSATIFRSWKWLHSHSTASRAWIVQKSARPVVSARNFPERSCLAIPTNQQALRSQPVYSVLTESWKTPPWMPPGDAGELLPAVQVAAGVQAFVGV